MDSERDIDIQHLLRLRIEILETRLKSIDNLIKENPNDGDLGTEIRKLVKQWHWPKKK